MPSRTAALRNVLMLFWLLLLLLADLLLVFYFLELRIDNFSFDGFFGPAALAGRFLTGCGLRALLPL